MAEHDSGLNGWQGRELFDANSQKIGTIVGLGYSRPKFGTMWLLVETAAGKTVLVPAAEIRARGDRLGVPYPKTYVEFAPAVDPGHRLSRAEQRRLCIHYGYEDQLPGGGCQQACGLCGAFKKREAVG